MALDPQTSRILSQQNQAINQLVGQMNQLQQMFQSLQQKPTTVQEEIDQVPGRRMEGALVGEVTFSVSDLGQRGIPILFNVSQDGPFIMTHYPMVQWRPSAPANATN